MPSDQELAALLEAAKAELPECDCNTSWHSSGCTRYQAMVAQADDEEELAALAPALAREVLDQREAGRALAEVVMKHAYAEGHDLTGPPRGCKPCRAALDRWAELTETEVSDG